MLEQPFRYWALRLTFEALITHSKTLHYVYITSALPVARRKLCKIFTQVDIYGTLQLPVPLKHQKLWNAGRLETEDAAIRSDRGRVTAKQFPKERIKGVWNGTSISVLFCRCGKCLNGDRCHLIPQLVSEVWSGFPEFTLWRNFIPVCLKVSFIQI